MTLQLEIDEMETENAALSSEQFSDRLEALNLGPRDLATIMQKYGDHRSDATILKSIRRMLSGETTVSAEIVVIVELIDKFRQAGESLFSRLDWQATSNERIEASHEGWKVVLELIRRCWRVSIIEPSGNVLAWESYSHLTNLENAKSTAEARLWSALNKIGPSP